MPRLAKVLLQDVGIHRCLDRVFRLDLTDVLHPSVGRRLVLPDLTPTIGPLDEGVHVAREVKLWQQDGHFLLELQQVASLKGILARLVQHLGNGVPALEDAVEVVLNCLFR